MDILEEIKLGEGKVLEFKERFPRNDQITKTVIAFSNTSGGKLIIGVNDDREVTGIDGDIFEIQDRITSILYESCHPNIVPEIYTKNIDGKLILVIEVFRGNLLPYYIKSMGKNNGTYIRIGATNRVASLENIMDLERQKRNISFDEEIDYDYAYSELDMTPLYREFDDLGKTLTEDKMINLKLLKEENGTLYPTRGLIILLGKYENVTTKCSRFKGDNMSVFLDKKEYIEDLFTQLRSTETFIKGHINLRGEIEGLQRKDTYEIPQVAIRETLMNAYVHRDYSNLGRDIKVGVYEGRLEVVSPGGFPSGLTNADIDSGRSEVRNRVIGRVFKELDFIEQWGSGITKIKMSCEEAGLKKPFIEEGGDFVGVRIFRDKSTGKVLENTEGTGEVLGNTESTGKVLEKSQEKIVLDFIIEHGSIKKSKVEELLKVKDSRARKVLEKMVENGLISKEGKSRATHYKLKSDLPNVEELEAKQENLEVK